MSAEEALLTAAQEGLELVKSTRGRLQGSAGFKSVYCSNPEGKTRPYQLKIHKHGRELFLGAFATAEEAALQYARHVGKEQAAREAAQAAEVAEAPPPMTAAEALAEAAREGLTLATSAINQTGFKCVSFHANCRLPYEAYAMLPDRKQRSLGCFATAEEAALRLARHLAKK